MLEKVAPDTHLFYQPLKPPSKRLDRQPTIVSARLNCQKGGQESGEVVRSESKPPGDPTWCEFGDSSYPSPEGFGGLKRIELNINSNQSKPRWLSENMCLVDFDIAIPQKRYSKSQRLINTHGNVVAELPHGYGTKLWLLSRSAAKLVDGW